MSDKNPNSPNSPNFLPIVRYAGAQAHGTNNAEALGLSGLSHSDAENGDAVGPKFVFELVGIPGIDVLIDHGYLIEPPQNDDTAMRKRGRPPSRVFKVNPAVLCIKRPESGIEIQ